METLYDKLIKVVLMELDTENQVSSLMLFSILWVYSNPLCTNVSG